MAVVMLGFGDGVERGGSPLVEAWPVLVVVAAAVAAEGEA